MRFISVRGPISLLRSDQGTAFVGAKAELCNEIKEIDNAKVREFRMKNDCI